MIVFPSAAWEWSAPEQLGIDVAGLERAHSWLDATADSNGYRFVLVKDGYLVDQRNRGYEPDRRLAIASAAKSIYSNVLGIAVEEKQLPSADAQVVTIFPEMMDVPEGAGPKEGRYAYPKDRTITFRQLICNTSGYMKPGEEPGQVFNYQTYGMNVLTHALARAYGLYDVDNPEREPGFAALVETRVGSLLGAQWSYSLTNFDLHPKARLGIFGYYTQIHTTALDLARVAWMWANWGRWGTTQVVPEGWMRGAVKVNPDLLANAPMNEWQYGHGFWTNEQGLLWPDLPREGFTAAGAGGHYATVFPSMGLVIVQNPGPYRKGSSPANPELLALVLEAVRG
jgi:CubicO group peptidase (beta-lactamase class C family)